MPVGYNHLYYAQFRTIVVNAGLGHLLPELNALQTEEEALSNKVTELRRERQRKAEEILETHYATIRPHLRPCHQKRFDRGKKEIEVAGSW